MGIERVRAKIEVQKMVYQALKMGNDDMVRYKEFRLNEKSGLDSRDE